MQSVFPQELISDYSNSRGRGTELFFQFRLQPRSRHGKTVSNDNNSVPCRSILFHVIPCHIILFHYILQHDMACDSYKNMTKQNRTRNETEHHIIQLAWNNKIGFVAYIVGLCAIGQCTLAFVAVRCRCRCVAGWWVLCCCVLVVCVLCVVCESWWCWCSWDCVCLCVSLYLWSHEYRYLHVWSVCVYRCI